MTCKDCIHYEACKTTASYFGCSTNNSHTFATYELRQEIEKDCADFKDKSRFIELPCKVGDTVYSIVPTYSKCHLGASWDEIRCQGCEDKCDSYGVYAIRQELVLGIAYNGSWSALTNKSGGNYKQIGSKIYGLMLTQAEAEKALAEREQK